MLRLWLILAFAIATASGATAANWQLVRDVDGEWYDRPTYEAQSDAVYVRIFFGTPEQPYDTRLMTNYETEYVMSCTKDLQNWRHLTEGISEMGWHNVSSLSSTWTALRDTLCAKKTTLPPWPGMNAQ